MNSATDLTRDLSMMMQQGVRDARRWDFGPFFLTLIEYPFGMEMALNLRLGTWCVHIGCWKQTT